MPAPIVDALYSTTHPITQAPFVFSRVHRADFSYRRESGSYAVATAGDGGINPFVGGAAPVGIRQMSFAYYRPYGYVGGRRETYTDVRDALIRAVGHGMEQTFTVACADGTRRLGRGVCNVMDFPATPEDAVRASFALTFEMVDPHLYDEYSSDILRYDSGLVYDSGLTYDFDPDRFALTTPSVTHTVTNRGNAATRAIVFTLTGPFTGPVGIINYAVPVGSGYMSLFIKDVSILATDTYVINVGQESIRKNGYPVYSALDALQAGQGEWFRFEPGANPLLITTYAATGTFNGVMAITNAAVPAGLSTFL